MNNSTGTIRPIGTIVTIITIGAIGIIGTMGPPDGTGPVDAVRHSRHPALQR